MISVVIPNWNGAGWLPACLDALAAQSALPGEVIVVDNGSTDGSAALLAARGESWLRLIELGHNTGFAHAVNVGLRASAGDAVALINTDVVLAGDWCARMAAALGADAGAASVACKMLAVGEPPRIYDAGDVLRRDGACEQRGRSELDDGRFDSPGEVFGACAGAALYRREAVLELGGFDERFFAYLEDVDLALRLRMAGWRCRYEPVVAWHAGEGSSSALRGGHHRLVARNTLLLVAKAFPARWLWRVAYRQLGAARAAWRAGALGAHLAGLAQALPQLPAALAVRRSLRAGATVSIERAVPPGPLRQLSTVPPRPPGAPA